jgi:Sulfotransferase family
MMKSNLASRSEHTVRRSTWNKFGDATSRRLWFLNSDKLCADARRRTGLQDFGDPSIEPALSILTDSLEREADLHPLGRFLMRVHVRDLLATRLQLTELWRRQSNAAGDSSIRRPVFITGMPRSGSTFLHELLAEDPENRAPRVWEVMFPVPGRQADRGSDPRVRKAAACLWWFRRLAPGADSVYPMRAHTPHECVAMHSYTLLSEEFVSTCRIPTYETFLRAADLRPVYLWQKRFLQHLQSGGPAPRWVLKSPDHVYGLEELFSVFPDAVVIQTHRDPLEVLRSSSQLTRVLYGLYARRIDGDQIGLREARMLSAGVERFIKFRDAHPELENRFMDLKYTDLVRDPLSTVQHIYDRLEIPLTETAAGRMRQLIAHRSRYPKRGAIPTLADLGLNTPEETRRFDQYCFRFGISQRQPG